MWVRDISQQRSHQLFDLKMVKQNCPGSGLLPSSSQHCSDRARRRGFPDFLLSVSVGESRGSIYRLALIHTQKPLLLVLSSCDLSCPVNCLHILSKEQALQQGLAAQTGLAQPLGTLLSAMTGQVRRGNSPQSLSRCAVALAELETAKLCVLVAVSLLRP